MPSNFVPGFMPSTSGLHFDNSFPHEPDLTITLPGGATIGIGDASNGLCGGMVFTAMDFHGAGVAPPPDAAPPPGGSPLFNYIVRRLFDSFGLPFGPGRYLWLMNPALPDHETWASQAGLAPHGHAWVMINEEWPKIRMDIDSGRLSPLGLVKIRSLNAGDLGHNHQVVAFGYDLNGNDLTLHLYDPNNHDNDNVTMSLNIGDPMHTTVVTFSPSDGMDPFCFFRTDYAFADPSSLVAAPPRWHDWEPLGGTITSGVGAASWDANRLDCFVKGTDNHMWHKWWDGFAWSGWEDLGGVIDDTPAAVSWGPNRIDCFARGTDNHMWHKWWDGAAWSGWEDLGGEITAGPAVASWAANRLDCFAKGTDNHLWHKWWDGAAWSGWEDLGGTIVDAPGAVSWGSNRIDCFARGTDNHMWHKWWDGAAWSGWEDQGGTILSGPSAASWDANRLDCFAKGIDNHMWHKWWDGAAWSGWEDLGGVIDNAPGAVSWGPNRIDCFARGMDNQMFHEWYG